MSYESLFQPLQIKNITIPNRLVMAPMTTVSGNIDGTFSDEEIKYLKQRASSDIGLIMTPACYVHKSGHAFENQVACHDDSMLDSLARCANAVNSEGALSFLQIHHGGNAAQSKFTGEKPWAPSEVLNRRGTSEMPHAMTASEIETLIDAFARSARRAQKAGFSGIEIHGANTYLFQQFFSPYTNKREDKWGCTTMENRCRFACEVIKAVRAEVGSDYPVAYRISPDEPEPDGYSVYDTIEFLKIIVPLGIDIIHVSSWEYGKGVRDDIPADTHPTKMIKGAFPETPVIGVGGIRHPDQAMRILNDGVDLVAIGQALLLDKDWGAKVKNGDIANIRTEIKTEDEREQLNIPAPMKKYTKRFL